MESIHGEGEKRVGRPMATIAAENHKNEGRLRLGILGPEGYEPEQHFTGRDT